MRKLLLVPLLFVPAVALALDYTDVSRRYFDAPFVPPEAAGISVLTYLGAVQGNPDGTFAPKRTLNRAEFLKIVLQSNKRIAISSSDAANCFPDVRAVDWFSRYVCLALRRGIVHGYPDGRFHPEREVNYAEALKILGEMYGAIAETPPGEWYVPYREGALAAGVGLPAVHDMAYLLTRGDMARLAAAYISFMEGELDLYRRAERGETIFSSSSSSSVSSISSHSSFSSSSATSNSSASSAISSLPAFPSRSQFLVAGQRSKPIAGNTFFANLEPMYVERATVKLENARDTIDTMFIIDADGTQLGQLSMDKVFDNDEKTWRGSFVSKSYRIEKSQQKTLGVEVRMKERNKGGTSEEMVEVDQFTISTTGEWTNESTTSGVVTTPYPKHQTSMGRITSVTNAMESDGILPLGPGQLLGAFAIAGTAVEGVTLRTEHLEFQLSKAALVNVANWQLGIPESNERHSCSVSGSVVSCSSIPASLGTLGGGSRTFRLYGDTSLSNGATDKNLQISLNLSGNLETIGAVRWTDGSGHFNWVELEQPLARGTAWK